MPFSRRPTASPSPAPRLIDAFDVLLFDLDGVVYVGGDPVPYAIDAMNDAQAAGRRLGYLTNNASRTPETVAAQLTSLGLHAQPDDIVTSPQAAVPMLASRVAAGAEILVVGGEGLRQEVASAGFRIVREAGPNTAGVIQGFAPNVSWTDLAEASYAIEAGAVWVSTNGDWTIPREKGIAPGNGTLVSAVHTASGAFPETAGKPERPIFDVALRRFAPQRALMVGDRLDTDILGANRAGLASLHVLTGVDGPRDVLDARVDMRPSYIVPDLRSLLTDYDAVYVDGDSASCGPVRATLVGNVLTVVAGDPGGIHAVRAACGLVWTAGMPASIVTLPEEFGTRIAG